MADSLASAVSLLTMIYQKYTEFKILKSECEIFRELLGKVRDDLHSMRTQYKAELLRSSQVPVHIEDLKKAVKEGADVLDQCASTKKLKAFIISNGLRLQLADASTKVKEARLLIAPTNVETRCVVEGMNKKIEELYNKLIDATKKDVSSMDAAWVYEKLNEGKEEDVVVGLQKAGIIRSQADLKQQFAEFKKSLDSKTSRDEAMLEAFKASIKSQEEMKKTIDSMAKRSNQSPVRVDFNIMAPEPPKQEKIVFEEPDDECQCLQNECVKKLICSVCCIIVFVIVMAIVSASDPEPEPDYDDTKAMKPNTQTPYQEPVGAGLTCSDPVDLFRLSDYSGSNEDYDTVATPCFEDSEIAYSGKWFLARAHGPNITIDPCSGRSDFKVELAIMDGTSCDDLLCVAKTDRYSEDCLPLTFDASPGDVFYILAYGNTTKDFGTLEMQYDMVLHESDGSPSCLAAIALEDFEYKVDDTTVGKVDDPMPCVSTYDIGGAGSVWYTVEGTGERFTASTDSTRTNADTLIAVASGDCSELECIKHDDGLGSNYAKVSWYSEVGTKYYIQVSSIYAVGTRGETGLGNFRLQLQRDPVPSNMKCEDAILLNGEGDSVLGSAKLSTDEKFACDSFSTSRNTVWYKVIGTGSQMKASTCHLETSFYTELAVTYNGCDLNACVYSERYGTCSTVRWQSQVGVEYHLQLGAWSSLGSDDLIYRLSVSSE